MKRILGVSAKGERFRKFSIAVAAVSGHAISFAIAAGFVLAWLVSGWVCDFSDSWQLVINTVTSIVTFLMVFIIQNSQNRENARINVKLDELIRSHDGACNHVIGIENLSDKKLEKLGKVYDDVANGKMDPNKVEEVLLKEQIIDVPKSVVKPKK